MTTTLERPAGSAPIAAVASPWRQVVRHALTAALPRRLFLTHGPATSGAVCLTFDDGPHPEYTPEVLDVLRDLRVPATFFVVGREVERYPELVRRMADEGHVVGHHSYSHEPPPKVPAGRLRDEVRHTNELLTTILGQPATLFRPPYGKVTARKLLGLWREGQSVVLWNVDPKDFARPSAEDLADWVATHPLAAGDVVLLHDCVAHTPAILPDLVARARGRGLRFTTVAEWTR